jgi:hypothetical protein
MVSLHVGWPDVFENAGLMLELIEVDGAREPRRVDRWEGSGLSP